MTSTRVVVAGATGWAGSALTRAILAQPDLELVGAVSRSRAGEILGDVLEVPGNELRLSGTLEEALASGTDVFVDYTHPSAAREHVLIALGAGAHVVVGTSGLDGEAYEVIGRAADDAGRGVLACGNFSITAVLMMRFSEVAARWLRSWEVIDYASAGKVDAPSGTGRELAERLAAAGPPDVAVPIDDVQGERDARGALMGGTHVHSVRLPSFVISIESIFGQPDERLTIRHDAGPSAEPYVAGALLAIRRVGGLVGLHRGLDTVMDLD